MCTILKDRAGGYARTIFSRPHLRPAFRGFFLAFFFKTQMRGYGVVGSRGYLGLLEDKQSLSGPYGLRLGSQSYSSRCSRAGGLPPVTRARDRAGALAPARAYALSLRVFCALCRHTRRRHQRARPSLPPFFILELFSEVPPTATDCSYT